MSTVTVNGIDINYRESGEGFPIVFVHGYTGNSRNWAFTVPALREVGFRTISMDLRGHGQSAKPTRQEDYALGLMAEDVYQLLSQLGVREYFLVGHSMGGRIAQILTLAHPEPIRALVLVDTAGEARGFLHSPERARLVEIAEKEGMEAAFDEMLRITPIPEAFKANPGYIETWREMFLMTSREAFMYCGAAIRDHSSRLDALRAISMPTLVICGEKDEPFLEPSRRMHEAIPGQRAGHHPGSGSRAADGDAGGVQSRAGGVSVEGARGQRCLRTHHALLRIDRRHDDPPRRAADQRGRLSGRC